MTSNIVYRGVEVEFIYNIDKISFDRKIRTKRVISAQRLNKLRPNFASSLLSVLVHIIMLSPHVHISLKETKQGGYG